MATITIRGLDENLKKQLRVRAAHNGRSMEAEARDLLRDALAKPRSRKGSLAKLIRQKMAPLGGVELPIPPREPMRNPPRVGA